MELVVTIGRISHNLYMKVDSDLEVNSRPALCARPVVFNAPDNLGIFLLANQLMYAEFAPVNVAQTLENTLQPVYMLKGT